MDWQEVQMFTNEMSFALRQGIRDGLSDGLPEVMTKRERFAMAAMQAMALKEDGKRNSHELVTGIADAEARWVATAAVRYADALIAALAVKK